MNWMRIYNCFFSLGLITFGNSQSVTVVQYASDGLSYSKMTNENQSLNFSDGEFTFCLRIKFRRLWEETGLTWLWSENNDDPYSSDDFQIELGLRRLRVSLSQTRRFYFLKKNLRAMKWHHICMVADKNSTGLYLDGELQQSVSTEAIPFVGKELRVGGVHPDRKYFGSISQVNMWDMPLSPEDVEQLANCGKDMEGNQVSWSQGQWENVGDVEIDSVPLNHLCKDSSNEKILVFPPMKSEAAQSLCQSMNGYLPQPTNALGFARKVNNMNFSINSFVCDKVWADMTDEHEEGQWTKLNDWEDVYPNPEEIEWKTSEPDGSIIQNCAVLDLRDGSIGFEDVECYKKVCSICIINEMPNWSLKGACIADDSNKNFIALQKVPELPMEFEGYSNYSIVFENYTWVWKLNEGRVVAKMVTDGRKLIWPLGRKDWTILKPICDSKIDDTVSLLLSPCKDEEFTCDDASCIPLMERCDLKPDCSDNSDETGCQIVQFPVAYRADLPPDIAHSKSKRKKSNTTSHHLPIRLNLVVESLNVDTSNMEMHTNLNLSMTWTDSRIDFWNLNVDKTLNRIPQKLKRNLWAPVVDFTNTKGNHITAVDKEAVLVANMQSEAVLAEDRWPEEVDVYPGRSNSLSVSRKYSHTFQCQFHLARYPFDRQWCKLQLTMLSASSRLLKFDEELSTVTYSGTSDLVEYTVREIKLRFKNNEDFAVVFVEVELIRQAGFILMNVYIPSMSLLVISYLTLYFNPAIFQVRVLGSLTALLVMTTVFTQASSSLPKTSYFKLVDVWLLSSILVIFTIICFHTVIDRLIEKEKNSDKVQKIQPQDSKYKKTPPSRLVTLAARVVLVLAMVLFNAVYWSMAFSGR